MVSFVHLLGSVQSYFTSSETIRTIRDGEPRTATSTFTQLSSHRNVCVCHVYVGLRAQGYLKLGALKQFINIAKSVCKQIQNELNGAFPNCHPYFVDF